jgi:Protein of unknown function (DUF3732)
LIQLKAIAIWNSAGERRTLRLQTDSLNIVTGEAKAGKSALLEIVEYCLGREEVSLPEGVLTRTVAWYGLLVGTPEQTVFVGRPAPADGQATVSPAQLEIGGPDLDFPPHEELETNTNAEAVTEYLTRLCGIGEYENQPSAYSTRPPLRPTIRHASLLCFQRQNEIANPRQLFHRQDEEFMPQAIKDTLPYFLGAVDREAPTLRSQLVALKRQRRLSERQLERARQIEVRGPERAAGLVAEAVDAGLIEPPGEAEPAETALRAALEASTEPRVDQPEGTPEYARLAERSRQVAIELRMIAERSEILRRREGERGEYRTELGEQAARLETLGLLPDEAGNEASHCPVCGSAVEEADATVAALAQSASETRAELEAELASAPGRRQALSELEERARALREELREVHAGLAAIAADRERINEFREAAMARAYVKGRIAQHLEQNEQVAQIPQGQLTSQVELLTEQIEEIEARLDPENERDQVASRLNVIAEDMSAWAERLALEHTGGRARIDPARLSVVVDSADGLIPLERMGSASNWVGYHLIAHLGLHRWFNSHNRPVPRFLMLDQPTQAFYPPEADPDALTDVATRDLSDDDRRSVEAMFSLLRDFVTALAPGTQLIVMDHANLADDWFQDSIVEVWRDGRKLVPTEWVDD